MAISYTRNRWKKADVLTADKLNNTEIALEAIVNKINGVSYDENNTSVNLDDSEKIASIQNVKDAIAAIPNASNDTFGLVKVGTQEGGLVLENGKITLSDNLSINTVTALTKNLESGESLAGQITTNILNLIPTDENATSSGSLTAEQLIRLTSIIDTSEDAGTIKVSNILPKVSNSSIVIGGTLTVNDTLSLGTGDNSATLNSSELTSLKQLLNGSGGSSSGTNSEITMTDDGGYTLSLSTSGLLLDNEDYNIHAALTPTNLTINSISTDGIGPHITSNDGSAELTIGNLFFKPIIKMGQATSSVSMRPMSIQRIYQAEDKYINQITITVPTIIRDTLTLTTMSSSDPREDDLTVTLTATQLQAIKNACNITD